MLASSHLWATLLKEYDDVETSEEASSLPAGTTQNAPNSGALTTGPTKTPKQGPLSFAAGRPNPGSPAGTNNVGSSPGNGTNRLAGGGAKQGSSGLGGVGKHRKKG